MKKPPRYSTSAHQVKTLKNNKGQNLCRWCKNEVVPPQRTFCGNPVCVHEWRIRSDGGYMRKHIFERDKGVCSSCGLDTEQLKQLLYRIKTEKGEEAYLTLLKKYEILTGYSFTLERHFFEVDHKIAVAQGGGSCGANNLNTVCIPCHKRKTKREAKRRRFGRH